MSRRLTTGEKLWLLMPPRHLATIIAMVERGEISRTAGKELEREVMNRNARSLGLSA